MMVKSRDTNINRLPNLWVLLAFVLFLPSFVSAQNVKFYINSDRDKVAVGETFLLEAVLENGDARAIQMPDLSPFKIVQGPSTSTSISIINGKRSATMSYQYMLLAVSKGKYTLGPASVKVGNKELKSNTLTINVVDADRSQSISGIDDSKETMIRLEVSEEKAFIGQQLVVSYVLYTRQNLESYNFLNEPEYEGFYAQPLNDFREQAQRKTINGKEYHRQVLRKVLLFPQKVGKYSFGPVNVSLDIPVDNGRSSFFFRDVKKEQTQTNVLKINVESLPASAPESFSGGVGEFTMQTFMSKNTATTDESLILTMTIEGDGDAKIVQAPKLKKYNGIESYEPSVIKDETYTNGDRLRVVKTFEYILVPTKDTTYSFTPEFSYYSPTSGKYETITSGPHQVTIVKGSGKVINPAPTDTDISALSPMETDLKLVKVGSPFFGSGLYFSLFGFIILATGLGIYFKKRKIQKLEQLHLSSQSSINIANKKLEKAAILKNENNKSAFFEEISLATIGYIQKKYDIPNMELGLNAVKTHLRKYGVDENLLESYTTIQQRCEMARFAGQYGDMDGLYEQASSLISELEKLR
jgi:BatD DUF11 like domain